MCHPRSETRVAGGTSSAAAIFSRVATVRLPRPASIRQIEAGSISHSKASPRWDLPAAHRASLIFLPTHFRNFSFRSVASWLPGNFFMLLSGPGAGYASGDELGHILRLAGSSIFRLWKRNTRRRRMPHWGMAPTSYDFQRDR